MKPEERENFRYSKGAQNEITIEEQIMFSLLPPLNKNNCLLDIGCGIGTIAHELKSRDFKVTGVDFSSVAIKKCLEKGLNAIISDVDKDGLQFPDNSFDVVWAGDVIEHVFDPIFLLEEIHRVLKQAGKMILSTPNDFNLVSRLSIFLSGKSIQSNIYRKLGQCKHHTAFSWELLNYMIIQSKMNVDSYCSILKMPKIKREKVSSNKMLGMLFGRIFIVRAHKK